MNKYNDEIFVDIPQFEGRYKATNYGRIWSELTQNFLSPVVTHNGYLRVALMDGFGNPRRERVGRLVALAFIGNPPEGKPQLDHIDRDRKNDRPDNLRWVSSKENNRNRTNNRAVAQYDKMTGELIATYGSVAEANEAIGRKPGHSGIFSCLNGKNYSSGGYIWEAI